MISTKEMQKAAEFIRQNCTATDFNFSINGSEELLTRFAQNGITQHISGNKLNVNLNVAFENKTGEASGNILDEDALKYLIQTAESMAELNQPDPEFVASEPAHDLPEVDNYAKHTADLSVEKIVDDILTCVKNAESKDAKLSGISEKNINNTFLATKNGFEGFDNSTSFSHSMTMKREGVETKVSKSVKDYATFNMPKLIERLNSQFDSLNNPVQLEKGKIPVILRPAAVLNWLFYLIWTFDRRTADEGHTPFTDQIGKQFFGKNFTFRSRLDDPDLEANKFLNGGIPAENIDWIVNGVIKNMSADRYYAKQKNLKALQPYNIIVDGGNVTETEMMKKVKRGVIVNNFWYIRPTDRKTGEWTGLTRDGVLYFEDGKIQKSVTNFRWNEILHDATKRILSMGPTVQQEYYAKVPTLLIDDFNFVDVTTF
ncbi:MAG: metallopeptidase TldD-related protein [Candidatus Cloacimonadales bacterium]|nr:metallopeptidase TldD-related protein [Candidatus Cloacimonadales bacterium]